jgi:hypothetical protein
MSNLGATLKNETLGYFVQIVRRGPEIDEILSGVGYDVASINRVTTPLFGASRYASAKVLVAYPTPAAEYGTTPYQTLDAARRDDKWTLNLFEAFANLPNTDTPKPAGSASSEYSKPEINTTGTIIPSGGSVVPTVTIASGRAMQWNNMLCVGIQEVMLSAGALNQLVNYIPGDPNQPSLYVMEFVDGRFYLQDQQMLDLQAASSLDGFAFDQWNMLADNPLHFVANTVKESTTIPPDNTQPWVSTDLPTRWGDWIARLNGIPMPEPWYTQKTFTPKEIIDTIIETVTSSKSVWLDRTRVGITTKRVSFDAQGNAKTTDTAATYTPNSKWDMANLDLRGKTVGQALDEIAGRMGCIWQWDRRSSTLILREAKPTDFEAELVSWLYVNQPYRTAGGLDLLSLHCPQAVISLHPSVYCSTYGITTTTDRLSKTIVDFRRFRAADGVEAPPLDPISATSPLFYMNTQSRFNDQRARTAYIGDHMPAFFGVVSNATTDWGFFTPSTDSTELEYPWNYDFEQIEHANWLLMPHGETLSERNETLVDRYTRLLECISGTMHMARLPDAGRGNGIIGWPMDRSPSPGLAWDEVTFGAPFKDQVRYKIWGEKQDELLFPNVIKHPSVSAFGLSRCRKAAGSLNIEAMLPRQGIVRTFLASFAASGDPLVTRDGSGVIWLYQITEVGLANDRFPTFQPMNEFNETLFGVSGFALNLCEMQVMRGISSDDTTTAPQTNFDGGVLKYNPPAGQAKVTMTSPRGIAPCYEIISEGGARFFWLYAPNGVSVTCSTTVPFTAPNPAWQKSGASGIADNSSASIASMIQQ